MRHYKLNFVSAQGRIVGRFEFRCESDAEATEASEAVDDPNAKELWCGSRWVCSWPAPVRRLRRAS